MQQSLRFDRVVLAIEVLFGALPITIVGGGYSLFGLLFGIVSVFLAVREHAFKVLALWLGILVLAAGGLVGIVGLWALIVLAAGVRSPSLPMVRVAIVGSVVGVLVAAVALFLMLNGTWDGPRTVVYILVAPIWVVLHRAAAIKRPSGKA